MNRSPFSVLSYRNFRFFWFGLLVARIGAEMQVVAVNWQIYVLTGSAVSLGLIGLARFIPVLVFSLIGGITADRFNRKKIMITSMILIAASSLFLAVSTFTGHTTPLILYLVIAINSIISSFDTPARQSYSPLLVPRGKLMSATSLNTVMWQTAVVLGPTLSGFLIAGLGTGSVYIANVLLFISGAVFLFGIKHVSGNKKVPKSAEFTLESILGGLRFVFRTPIIYSTMLLDFFATFFASATVLLPIFAKDILNVGPQGMGILYAAPAVGAVLAGLAISSFHHIKHQGRIILSAILLYGVATIVFGVSRSFWLSLFVLSLTGVGDVVSTVIRNTIRQLKTPDHLRGRMVSVNMIFFMGGPQLGEVEAGFAAALLGSGLSVITGGIGTILATLAIAYFIPQIRKYKGEKILTA